MFIGEVCRHAGCTPRTVRHYEAQGILTARRKTAGGRKIYDAECVAAICAARLLKRLGYALKDIRQIMRLRNSGDTAERCLSKGLRGLLETVLSRLNGELELLSASRRKIARLLEETAACEGCRTKDCEPCGKLARLRTLGLL